MKAMEDKIKAVIEELERLCPTPTSEWTDGRFRITAWVEAFPKRWELYIKHRGGSWLPFATLDSGSNFDNEHSLYFLEMFYLALGLGVQSTAPDENGPIPKALFDLSGKIVEAFKTAKTYTKEEWAKVDFRLLNELWDDAIEEAWNTRAHAPSDENAILVYIQHLCHEAYNEAGKNWQRGDFQSKFMDWWESYFPKIVIPHAPIAGNDPITESMRQEYNEVLSIARKRQEAIDELRSKSAKLIEALEEISNELRTSADVPKMLDFIKVMADKALAAYKGKEGGA